ncbi:MAG: hypothetical protein Q7U10_04495 [Thermodesulfovibrionia bacterium]|nr:hypothetical protein [Thermodesulfovibrionia bacterium]
MKVIRKIIITFFALLLLCASAFAEEKKIETSGYIRSFLIFTNSENDDSTELLSRLRLRLFIPKEDNISWEFAYELLPRLRQDAAIVSISANPQLIYRAFDLDELVYPGSADSGSDLALYQNLDRANVTFATDHFDVFIGRQALAFGSARVINPTDIIAPFTYNTIAKEELTGVDAIRIKTPFMEMGEIDMGVVSGHEFKPEESAAFIRSRSYIKKTDVSVMAMVFKENVLIGLDIARAIKGAGVWLEAAQVFANAAESYRPDENYFRLSAGADYSFTEKLYGYIEYHYSGAGSGRSGDYFSPINKTAFREGAVYLLGRHYIAPGFSYQITPLLLFSGSALINLNDGSALLSPVFEYSIVQDIYANLGAYIGSGDSSDNMLKPESEFGLYPDTYYAALNFYF